MTMHGGMTPPEGATVASAAVAESLSTLGYAMFALVRRIPLDEIPSMDTFVANARAAEISPGPDTDNTFDSTLPPAGEQEFDSAVAEAGAFGAADVGEDFGAITSPAALDPNVSEIAERAHAAQVAAEQAAAMPPPAQPMELLQPSPEYTGSTLAMLQEINFLDE